MESNFFIYDWYDCYYYCYLPYLCHLVRYHQGLQTKKEINIPTNILKIEKGNLSVGNDADFCIVDLNKPWIVKQENLYSKSKNTSIENKNLQGKVTNTFVKGEELFKL